MKYFSVILLTLIGVISTDTLHYIGVKGDDSLGYSTYLIAFVNYISIAFFVFIGLKRKWLNDVSTKVKFYYKIWLVWNVFGLFYGMISAGSYWDWKYLMLSSVSFSLIPLVFFIGQNLDYTKRIFRFVLRYIFPFGFLFIPLALITNHELYSRLMIFVSLFLLFIPYVKLKWKLLIIIVAVTSVLMVIGFRANLIKIAFSLTLLGVYFFREFVRLSWIQFTHILLFGLPVLLFILGISGDFNPFSALSKNEGFNSVSSDGKTENLMADSRTLLYVDVLLSLNDNGNWIIGEGASNGFNSQMFYNKGGAIKGKRYRCEVGILNILFRNGIVGVLIYMLFLYYVSYSAIKHSNNTLAKMLGLYIAFRWPLSFVEEFTQYDLNFYFFWLAIGLVSTKVFRKMNDDEIRNYFKWR